MEADLNTTGRWRFCQYPPLFLSSTSLAASAHPFSPLHPSAIAKSMSSVHTSGGVSPVPGSAGRLQGYIQDRRVIGVCRSSPFPRLSFLTHPCSSMTPSFSPPCSATRLSRPLLRSRPLPPLATTAPGFCPEMTIGFLLLSAPT